MKAASMTASRKHAPRNFKEAFARVLLNETGVAVNSGALRQEQMDNELQLALRLAGFSGDAPHAADASSAASEASGTWSEDAEELMQFVRQLGPRSPHLSSEQFLKPFFRHLALPGLSIRELDDDVARFSKLTFLDVSRNGLSSIDNLPPNLKYLKAYNNPISQISCKASPSLCFLGLGFSKLGSEGLEQAARRFKNLLSLDLSFSQLAGLQEVIAPLGPLHKLRHLCLGGSPVSLLPFYRVQVLRWLPQLHVLDGVAFADEEQADSQQLVAWGTPLRPRPSTVRVAFQFQRLAGTRALLMPVAEGIVAAKRAAAAAAGEEAQEEEQEQDKILEACAGGSLRLRVELPDGSWAETAEVLLSAEDAAAAAAAAGAEDPPLIFDDFDKLEKLRTPAGEALYFEVDIGEEGSEGSSGEVLQEDGLVRLCRWARKGLAVKVFFRPASPPPPEGEEEAAAEGDEGEGGESKPKTPEPPEEVDVGGAVIALDNFLWHSQTDLGEEVRAAGELPESPAPWSIQVPEVRVVVADRWLDPEVQVPPLEAKAQRKARLGDARLALTVEMHAGEPPPFEEEDPAAAEPPKKGKK